MVKPDYNGGSIVNLVASIESELGGKPFHKPLKLLKNFKFKRNIVLLVVDGVGFYDLKKYDNFLSRNIKGSMTSVFPSTTAAAIPSFMSGLSPGEHGLMSWFMYVREIGMVVSPLTLKPMIVGNEISELSGLFPETFFSRIKAKASMVTTKEISKSSLQKVFDVPVFSYNTLRGFPKKIKEALYRKRGRNLVYAYYPFYDGLCHHYGINHNATIKHLSDISKAISSIDLNDTSVIVTADHGMVDASEVIFIGDEIADCLLMPLCGEPRAAFAYLRNGYENKFLKLMKQFDSIVRVVKSSSMKKFFGPNFLYDMRIGDYILIPKGNRVITDNSQFKLIGNHGGLSKEEMLVPLVIF